MNTAGENSLTSIPDFSPGMHSLSAADLNGILHYLQRLHHSLLTQYGAEGKIQGSMGQMSFPAIAPDQWIGIIVNAGPANEADYTQEQYWVTRARINNNSPNKTDIATVLALPPTHINQQVLTVTNFAEVAGHSHLLQTGRPVVVRSEFDLTDVSTRRYWIDIAPMPIVPVKIKTVSGSSFPRTYTVKPFINAVESWIAKNAHSYAEDFYDPQIINSYEQLEVDQVVGGFWEGSLNRFGLLHGIDFNQFESC